MRPLLAVGIFPQAAELVVEESAERDTERWGGPGSLINAGSF